MAQGITGTPDTAARSAAPSFPSWRDPFGLRPPSGKIPTSAPRRSLVRARLMALGSASSVRRGIVSIPQ